MQRKQCVVIGGGLGGLAVALRLAAKGLAVTVCEQGESFGGKMNLWEERGFRFDTGPSLITMPWIFAELFADVGSDMKEHLELTQVHPISDYIYPDGTRFSYSASMPEWLVTLKNLDSRDIDGFLRFLKLGSQLYEVSKDTFLRRRPLDWPRMKDASALKHMPWRYGWGNYHKTVQAHFRSPHLQQLYDRYPTYVGSSPYKSPATLAVIPYIEYSFGGWYIKGGLYRIVESLLNLARQSGISLLTNARVERIEHSNEKVSAVQLADGQRISADVIVMNGDASYVPQMLGEKGNGANQNGLAPAKRSMSGFVMLLGVRRTMPELHHHAIYFSADYKREFDELFEERTFPSDPTIYVNAPSRSDRSVVPGEGETLFVMANAPANDDDLWDESQIAEVRRRVFARLRASGFPDIENDIVVSDVFTPGKIGSRYLMPGGAIYGTHSHGWKHAFLRPPNKDKKVKGLYYVGGSTHPGGGTPTVLLSAQITSELIERYETA
ncbi:MAG: phytoene desaturase family protein [Blastocatellales bacterium]